MEVKSLASDARQKLCGVVEGVLYNALKSSKDITIGVSPATSTGLPVFNCFLNLQYHSKYEQYGLDWNNHTLILKGLDLYDNAEREGFKFELLDLYILGAVCNTFDVPNIILRTGLGVINSADNEEEYREHFKQSLDRIIQRVHNQFIPCLTIHYQPELTLCSRLLSANLARVRSFEDFYFAVVKEMQQHGMGDFLYG